MKEILNIDFQKIRGKTQGNIKLLNYAAIGAAVGTLAIPERGTAVGYMIGIKCGVYSMRKEGEN
ncbi:hypothetical protein [Paenibacillus nuruki]|uniref:hypothetical protein n=1 Tax=Paenibacillus nuruki TaxID=1886670 RepID=UPI0008479C19|nr:hypothetical protein [Paenibacillus nuruki]